MADVTNFKIGENVYNIKDATARDTANTAKTTALEAYPTYNEIEEQIEFGSKPEV